MKSGGSSTIFQESLSRYFSQFEKSELKPHFSSFSCVTFTFYGCDFDISIDIFIN